MYVNLLTYHTQGERKVVCGDGEGCLLLFNWGLWGDITDRFPGHPQSIDSLLATSDSVVCSGCMDGAIRWIHDMYIYSVCLSYTLCNVGGVSRHKTTE